MQQWNWQDLLLFWAVLLWNSHFLAFRFLWFKHNSTLWRQRVRAMLAVLQGYKKPLTWILISAYLQWQCQCAFIVYLAQCDCFATLLCTKVQLRQLGKLWVLQVFNHNPKYWISIHLIMSKEYKSDFDHCYFINMCVPHFTAMPPVVFQSRLQWWTDNSISRATAVEHKVIQRGCYIAV